MQLSVGSVLGVLSSSRLLLPLQVGSQALWFDVNMIIFTGRGKVTTFTLVVIIANLLPCCWVYDWAGRFASKAIICTSTWQMSCVECMSEKETGASHPSLLARVQCK